MKIKHLIIVSLILAILTIGAASASQDVDTLADSADDSLSVDDIDVVSEGEDGEDGDDGGDDVDDVDASDVDVDLNGIDGEEIDISEMEDYNIEIYAPTNATGKVAVIIDNDESNPAFESDLSDITNTEVDEDDSDYITYSISLGQLNYQFVENTQYSIFVKYFDGNYDNASDSATFTIAGSDDSRDDPGISIWCADEYLIGSDDSIRIEIEERVSGNVTVLLNDEEICNITEYDWEQDDEYYFDLNLAQYDLKLGEYTIVATFAGDEFYAPDSDNGTFDVVFIKVEKEGDSQFEISLADDATGTVEIFINDKSFLNITAEELKENSYYDLDLPFGIYDYEVVYKDDEKYSSDVPIDSGELEVSYYFVVDFIDDTYGDDEDDHYIKIGENATFGINLVRDAKGPVVISYNGKNISVIVHDSEDEDDDIYDYAKYVSISDLDYGENVITFSYKDDKYPLKTIEKTVYVEPIFEVPETVKYAGDELITLVLPQNATGNLIIKKFNESSYEYDEILANVSLVDGKANYSLANMPLGQYRLNVYYDGDDYGDDEDLEKEVTVSIIPNADVPECIYNETENTITVILPDDVDENLIVTINDYYYIISEEIYNAVANGTVNVKLPNLTAGNYMVYLTYGGEAIYSDNGYSYFELEVRDNEPVFDLNVTFPTVVANDCDDEEESSQYWEVSGIPENANGELELYINGKLYSTYYSYNDEYSISNFDLFVFGENTWEVKFVNDKYYKETSKSGKVTFNWANIPEIMNNDEKIKVNLNDKEGYVDLIIDGKAYKSEFLKDGEAKIPITDLALGTHTYEINYYDNNNVKQLTQSGSFNVTFYMESNIYNDEDFPNPLVDEFELVVDVPEDATGTIQVSVDGNNYTADIVNGTASFIIKDLVLGDNNFTITYSGDSKYPSSEIKEVLKIGSYAIEEKQTEYYELDYVAICLPSDANGTLVIYNAEEDENGDVVPVGEAILTEKLVNGVAKINASRFPKGVIYMLAVYESEMNDYKVEPELLSYTILPDVIITDEIVLGDNATFSIDLPGATGNISVYDGDNFIDKFEIIDGKVQGNISGLGLGDHDIFFEYEGDNYTDLFGEEKWVITVAPKKVDIPEKFNEDGSGEIALEVAEGSSGKVSVYEVINKDDEYETLVPVIENANYTSENKTVSVSGLKPGQHDLRLVYTDNETGDSYVKDAKVEVPKVDSSKSVNIPESISGDTLDINLPKEATGNVLVTVDGKTTSVPIKDGVAQVNLSDLAAGDHDITIKYSGNENCSDFVKSAKFNKPAVKVDPNLIIKEIGNIEQGKEVIVEISAVDSFSGEVKVQVGDVNATATLVNGKGNVTVSTASFTVGAVSVKVSSDENDTFLAGNAETTFNVTAKQDGGSGNGTNGTDKTPVAPIKKADKITLTLKKVKVKKSAKKLVLKATLKINGKYAKKGTKVVFKFKGKKYTAKVKAKGVAKVTIKKKVLKKLKVGKKVKYQVSYGKKTVKRTVKVKK